MQGTRNLSPQGPHVWAWPLTAAEVVTLQSWAQDTATRSHLPPDTPSHPTQRALSILADAVVPFARRFGWQCHTTLNAPRWRAVHAPDARHDAHDFAWRSDVSHDPDARVSVLWSADGDLRHGHSLNVGMTQGAVQEAVPMSPQYVLVWSSVLPYRFTPLEAGESHTFVQWHVSGPPHTP